MIGSERCLIYAIFMCAHGPSAISGPGIYYGKTTDSLDRNQLSLTRAVAGGMQ